jgi:CheY-like chemotaxis protein
MWCAVPIRSVIAEVLREAEYFVIEAADGHNALHILQSQVKIDHLLTDAGPPGGMNGRQIADAPLQIVRIKVVFITGYAESTVSGNG